MRLFYYILSYIFKCFDIHECHWMNHPHLSLIIRQLTATLNKASIKIRIKLQRFLVVVVYKFFQFRTQVCAISIRRIGHSHIKLMSENIQKSHGIAHF